MPVRVAINGFGRTGRSLFRAIYNRSDLEVAAINDIADPKALEYLLRYDSLRGHFPEPVKITGGHLYAKGRRIPVLSAREPGEAPWYDYGIDVVIEATGRFRKRDELKKHLDAGADRVILTYPPRDSVDRVYLSGVANGAMGPDERLISCGSSTANCVALMVKVLDDAFGVKTGFFTSIHAYTTEQSLIDVPSMVDLRLSRAANENIVPVASWSAKAVTDAFPHLEGKFDGRKLNVPVADASCVDLVTTHDKPIGIDEVRAVFRSASESVFKGLLTYVDEPIVSRDAVGSTASCMFDSLQTMAVGGDVVKTFGWYDQSNCLVSRVMDVLGQVAVRRGS